jgi:hypothetical protein
MAVKNNEDDGDNDDDNRIWLMVMVARWHAGDPCSRTNANGRK